MPLETRTAFQCRSAGQGELGEREGSSSGRVPGPSSVAGQSSVYEQKERQADGDTATRTSRCTIAPSPVARRPSPVARPALACRRRLLFSPSHCRDSNDLFARDTRATRRMTGVVQCVTAHLGEVIQQAGVASGPVGQSARAQASLRVDGPGEEDWPRCQLEQDVSHDEGKPGSDSGWQMDSADERHGGHLFPTLPSTDTTRGEVGGDKVNGRRSSGRRGCMTTRRSDDGRWRGGSCAWRALSKAANRFLQRPCRKPDPARS